MTSKPSYEDLEQRVAELEKKLETTEHFYNNILNSIPDIIFIKDDSHRWILLNDASCEVLGHERGELIGKTDYDFHSKERADEYWEKDNEVLFSESLNVNEELIADAHGNVKTILTKKSVFKDDIGNRFIVGIAHDITEQKRAEHALADSERRLADIIEFLPDSTWVIDIEGRVVAWNRAIEKMTGIKKEEILGKGDYEYSIPFYGERRPTLIDLILKRNQEYEKRYLSIRETDGELAASVSFSPSFRTGGTYLEGKAAKLYDAEGNVVGAIETVRDITAIKRAEQDRERLITELKEALANVRTLSGLLPICSSCKKIRDDKGYWTRIEAYIKRHAEVNFTHGLCPECAEKLYGREDWFKKGKSTE
ncbi:PAS domain-containing protein [Desulfatitalea tepidiphila]|uniref:PAS domain-containing protein n=1 Tax=Desulfatitalea tepidiphila TaxID=1185843 RepID=UPI0006B519E5|nr:PAS domain S-box protein [Desulfatitalea tepidiphila]